MTEHASLEQRPCASCGAQAVWNPARQALVCSHCGTVAPCELHPNTGEIQEIDLVRALRDLPDESRGWQTERRSVQCQRCHAVSVFDPARVGQNCEFCGSAELLDYAEIKAPIRPASLLAFKLPETEVREGVRRWFASKWLAPERFKRAAAIDTLRGVYLPYWTFDAQVDCPWTAESGTYYFTTETARDSSGHTRSRQVRHTRWTPAEGRVQHFFDDVPVPGTKGVDLSLLRGVEPFPTSELVPYDPAYLAGFVVEHYQTVLIDAAQQARASMEERLRSLCAGQVPGDTHRDLQINPTWSGETFKHILIPVYLLTYTYGDKHYQVVANGYTGKIAGRYPLSFWKVFLLSALAALILAVVLVLALRK